MKRSYALAMALLLLLSMGLAGCGKEQPSQPAAPDHSFALTAEQLENYQSAVSYVLKREAEDYYLVQYSKCGVTLKDGRLYTDFDGMAVQVSNGEGQSYYPDLKYYAAEDGKRSAIGTVVFTNYGADTDGSNLYASYRWMFEIDTKQNTAALTAMTRSVDGADEQLLQGKTGEMPAFSSTDALTAFYGYCYETTYGENGALLPIKEWDCFEWTMFDSICAGEDVKVDYVPLKGGEYYILYEVTDQQGNTYCSDLIPYETERVPVPKAEPTTSVKWEKGKREVLLLERDGIGVYISVEKDNWGDSFYTLKVKNGTDADVYVSGSNVILNETVSSGWYSSLTVEPGKFVADDSGRFSVEYGAPETQTLKTMQLTVAATEDATQKPLFEETVLVDMTDAWQLKLDNSAYFNMQTPFMDMLVTEQVLLDNEQLCLSLMGAGALREGGSDLVMVLKLENKTDLPLEAQVDATVINGVYDSGFCYLEADAGCVNYEYCMVYGSIVEDYTNPSIETLSLWIEVEGQEDWALPSSRLYLVPIVLSQSGKAEPFDMGQVLWEEDGWKVGDRGYDAKSDEWPLAFTNGSEKTAYVRVVNMATGEEYYDKITAGPGQYAMCELYNRGTKGVPMTVRFRVYDYETGELLKESPNVVLTVE